MKARSLLVAIAVSGLALLQCAATAPPQEQDAIDFTVPSVGIPPTWFVSSGTGKVSDAYVVLMGPNSGSGSTTDMPILVGWTRTGNGPSGWTWTGVVDVPGLPPAMPIPFYLRSVVSNGVDESVHSPAAWRASRRVNGAWEYRGDIPFNFSPNYSNMQAVDGDTAAVSEPPAPKSIVQRQQDGTWHVVSTFSGGSTVQVSGDRLIYGGFGGVYYPWASIPFRDGVIQRDGSLVLNPAHAAPVPMALNFASFFVTDGEWVAAQVDAFADSKRGIAFYRYQPDGSLVQTQFVADAGGEPADLRNGRMVSSNAVWSVDGKGVWHRGAQLNPNSWSWGPSISGGMGIAGLRHHIVGEDVVCLIADASSVIVPDLKIWKNAFDCDANGVDDAIEIAQDPSQDCNLNGRKDSCDIADGTLLDLNQNGIADACEADCDGNLVPDLTQIRAGAPAACDGTTLASCAIASGGGDDNGDGYVDACGPDLNSNGVPDYIEVISGGATDCDGDGIPDNVPVYQTSGVWEGPGGLGFTGGTNYGVMMCETFVLDSRHPTLTGVSFRIQRDTSANVNGYASDCSAVNRSISVAIARDPNADAKPADAEVLAYATGIATDEDWQTLVFDPVTIDTPFFFAVFTVGPKPGSNNCLDLDFADCYGDYELGFGQCERLAWGAFIGNVPADYQAALRACAGNSLDNAVVPIAVISAHCTNPADFNHDGVVNGVDLGMLLGAWGPANGSPCDLNQDSSVDGADLGMLIGAWGAV